MKNMKRAPVGVVIPTFNSGHLVTEAIDSVLRQSVVPAEIIVVDDGSKDDTRERVARYGQQIRYLYHQNQGVSATRNRGVQEAGCEYIAFLDADDVWHPKKLELQLAALSREPGLGLLGTRTLNWPAARFAELADLAGERLEVVPWERLVVKNCFVTSSILTPRRILRQVGLFDTGLQGPEDYDLWLRVAEVSRVANLDLPLTGYREVPSSLSKQAAQMEAGVLKILAKLDERGAWRGRRLLRRKAYSHASHSCAYMYGAAGYHARALLRSIGSLLSYPFPYRKDEVRVPLERPKRLVWSLLHLLHLG